MFLVDTDSLPYSEHCDLISQHMNNVQEYPVPCETSIDPVNTSPATPSVVASTNAYHIEMNKISRLNSEPVRAAEEK